MYTHTLIIQTTGDISKGSAVRIAVSRGGNNEYLFVDSKFMLLRKIA